MPDTITINLAHPTVFPDLNEKENKPEDFARASIQVERMRYGHIKEMQALSPEQQTTWAIKKLTGLSDKDMDQLLAEDAAELTKTIFGFIEKYFMLAKKIWTDPEAEPKNKRSKKSSGDSR